MDKKKISKNQSKSFWQKVHQYRLKIGFFLFVIVAPVALILTIYIGAYQSNNKVYFDASVTPDTTLVSKFISPDELKAIKLNIKWYGLKYPVANDENELQNGNYTFDMSYETKETYEVLQVTVTPVLQTPWKEMRSLGSQMTLKTTNTRVLIPFNFELPERTLLFINITDPVLYLKVETNFMSAGRQITQTEYVKLELTELNPTDVS